MADSRVVINTKLDNRGILKGARDAARKVQFLADEFKNTADAIKMQESNVAKLKRQYDEAAAAAKEIHVDPAQLEVMKKASDAAYTAFIKQANKLDELRETAIAADKEVAAAQEKLSSVGAMVAAGKEGTKAMREAAEAAKDAAKQSGEALTAQADTVARLQEEWFDATKAYERYRDSDKVFGKEAADEAERLAGEIETANEELSKLNDKAENLTAAMARVRESVRFGFLEQAREASENIEYFEQAIEDLYDQLEEERDPSAIIALRHEIFAAETALEDFQNRLSRPVADIMEAQRLQRDINRVSEELDSAREEYDRLYDAMQRETNLLALMRLQRECAAAGASVRSLESELSNLHNRLGELSDADLSAPAEGAETASSAIDRMGAAAQRTGSVATAVFKRIGAVLSVIGRGAARAARGFLSMSRNLLGIGRSSRRASGGLDRMWRRLRNIAVTALVFGVIRRALNGLVRDLGKVLMANENFARSWNEVRVNMLTAFAPLWEVIQPAITSFMQLLARFTAVLAQFMATLFGRTIQQTRASAKAMHEQAKGIGKVGAAAEEAQKQKMGFDELNVLSDSGSGGGGADADALNFDIEIPDMSWIDEFAEKLKKIFSESDFEYWFELGTSLAEKLAGALESIPWEGIQEGARNLGINLAGLAGGLLSNRRMWAAWGRTAAQAINTAAAFLNSFAGNFPWRETGEAVGVGINAFVEDIDVGLMSSAVNNWVLGLLDLMIGVLDKTNWNIIGRKIAELLNGIRWRDIFTKTGEFAAKIVNAIVDVVGNFARGFDWRELGLSIAAGIMSFFNNVDWAEAGQAVSNLALGLLRMFSTAIRNVDWRKVGNDIKTFLSNIDWAGVWEGFVISTGSIIRATVDLIVGIFGPGGTAAIAAFATALIIAKPLVVAAAASIGVALKAALLGPIGIAAGLAAIILLSLVDAAHEALDQAEEASNRSMTMFNGLVGYTWALFEPLTSLYEEVVRFADGVSEETRKIFTPIFDNADAAREKLISMYADGKPVVQEDAIEVAGYFTEMANTAIYELDRMKNASIDNLAIIFGEEAEMFEKQMREVNRFYDEQIEEINRKKTELHMAVLSAEKDFGVESAQAESARRAYRNYSDGSVAAIAELNAMREASTGRLISENENQLASYFELRDGVAQSYEDQRVAIEEKTADMLDTIRDMAENRQAITLEGLDNLLDANESFLSDTIKALAKNNEETAVLQETRNEDLYRIDRAGAEKRLRELEASEIAKLGELEKAHNAQAEELEKQHKVIGNIDEREYNRRMRELKSRYVKERGEITGHFDTSKDLYNGYFSDLYIISYAGATESGEAITSGVKAGINDGAREANEASADMMRNITTNMGRIAIEGGSKGAKGFGSAWIEGFKSIFGISSPSKVAIGFGDNIASSFAIGLDNNDGGYIRAANNIVGNLASALRAGAAQAREIGSNIARSIGDGIASAKDAVVNTARDVGNAITNGVKNVLRISSPSKVFRDEIGKQLGFGLVEGFGSTARLIGSTIVGTLSDAQSEAGGEEDAFRKFGELVGDALLDGLKARYDIIIDFFKSLMTDIQSVISGRLPIISPAIPNVNMPQISRSGIVDSITIAAIAEKGRGHTGRQSDDAEWMAATWAVKEEVEITNSLLRQLIESTEDHRDVYLDGKLVTDTVKRVMQSNQRMISGRTGVIK